MKEKKKEKEKKKKNKESSKRAYMVMRNITMEYFEFWKKDSRGIKIKYVQKQQYKIKENCMHSKNVLIKAKISILV